MPVIFLLDQEDTVSDHESAMSVDEGTNSGGGAQVDSSGSGRKKQKNQKKKFDISLPAQHLVSNSSNLDITQFNLFLLPTSPPPP